MPKNSPDPAKLPKRQGRFRCVIVEDQVMFEQGLRALLQAGDLVDIVAAAHSVKEGVEACRRHKPDILLLDLALPDGSGLAVARALAACRPGARTIVISAQADTFRCPPALRKHIYSVIDKTRSFAVVREELAGCLGRVSPATASPAAADDLSRLTPREAEVFRLLGRGLSTKEIAGAAFISPRTVETHRKRIAAKPGVRATAMVRRAALHAIAAAPHSGA